MNPLDGVEAIGAARAPLATLQALAEALAVQAPQGPGLAEESAAPGGETPLQAAAQSDEAMLPPMPPVQATGASPGTMTLGQLATEQAALRAVPESAAADGARAAQSSEPLPDAGTASLAAGAAPRLTEMLAVPVLLNPLQPPATPPARPDATEPPPRRVLERQAPHDEAPAHDRDPEPDPDPEPPLDDELEAAATPEAAELHALLEREGQADALSELARGRRVLVVLPGQGAGHGVVDATAWLLGGGRARRFGARWWPGAAQVEQRAWLHWRVFRDGDPLLGRGLSSRAGGPSCRVRLGAQPQGLADADSAGLVLADRIRFSQSLGGQWSVLLIAAPPGRNR